MVRQDISHGRYVTIMWLNHSLSVYYYILLDLRPKVKRKGGNLSTPASFTSIEQVQFVHRVLVLKSLYLRYGTI